MEVKTKRYYVSSQMVKHKFKKVGPFRTGFMGDACNNWERGNLKVKRVIANGKTFLYINKNGATVGSFNISTHNPERDNQIAAFEVKLAEAVAEQNAVPKVQPIPTINKTMLSITLDVQISKLTRIKVKVLTNKPITLEEQNLLKKYEIM